MATELYFDKVIEGVHGQTTNGDTILYNLNLIDKDKCEEFSDYVFNGDGNGTIILPAGRFLVIATASLGQGGQNMVAIDFKDNEYLAKKQFAGDKNEKVLMATFYLIRQNKSDHNKFILREGQIPSREGQDQ